MSSDLPAPVSWWSRSVARMRAVLIGTKPREDTGTTAGRYGIASRRVASAATVAPGLSMLAMSPTTYAGLLKRALSIASYPVRAYESVGMGDVDAQALDPDAVPWLASMLRLLALPDPADRAGLEGPFPAEPGELLQAQLVADLLATGNAWVAPTMTDRGDILSLKRLSAASTTLERIAGAEYWVERIGSDEYRYPRRTVAHLRLLRAGSDQVLGTGAYTPLRALLAAEQAAMAQTATVVQQGGADVMVTGKSPTAQAFLQSPTNREAIAAQLTTALAGGSGESMRRVMVVGGDLDVKDSGLTPSDLRAPELMAAARDAELMALGVTPASVGVDTGSYATAVQQARVQASSDEEIAMVLEVALLRPLAQHFARRAGGRWARAADRVTCRLDLSTHPGWAFARTEQLQRMRQLVELGWTNAQASSIEGLDLPEPEGEVLIGKVAAPGTGNADEGAAQGGAQGGAPDKPAGEGVRLVRGLLHPGD